MIQIHLPHKALVRATVYDTFWHAYGVRGPLYWDGEQRVYPLPTAYSDSEASYYHSISYDSTQRQYLYKLEPFNGPGVELEIQAQARGIPFWIGKPEGAYIIHGACKIKEDVDIWGAYWDVGIMKSDLKLPDGRSYTFYGGFLWDRAYHRVYYSDSAAGTGCGAPLSFTALGIQGENVDMMILQSIKPAGCPVQTPVPFQHQGRINFPLLGKDFTFDHFTYHDNGGLQPDSHYLSGRYAGGEVNLVGTVFRFWPPQWHPSQGVYWDSTLRYVWGRAFIRWNGFLTLEQDTIWVKDWIGIGEFTRDEPGPGVRGDRDREMESKLMIAVAPTPFTGKVKIDYSIPSDIGNPADVSLKIFDPSGREVRSFPLEQLLQGVPLFWDGTDSDGRRVSPGVYFCRLAIGELSVTKKVLFLKPVKGRRHK